MSFTLSSNAADVSRALAGLERTVSTGTRRVTRQYGERLRTQVRANASGRPGPRAQTGDYRRSIGLEVYTLAGQVIAMVGTNAPQGRRLEYGFTGTESVREHGRVNTHRIGTASRVRAHTRHVDQPPLPHFRPALERIAPAYEKSLAQMVNSAVEGR